MAIQMTRAEYEAKYGVKPVISAVSGLDTTPAPTIMTKDEYNKKYRPEAVAKTTEETRKEDWRYKVGDFLVNKTPIGIPFKIAESAKAGVDKFISGTTQGAEAIQTKSVPLFGRSLLNQVAGGAELAISPITGVISWASGLPGIKQTISTVDKYAIQPAADLISKNPYVQSIAESTPQDVAENMLLLGTILYGNKKAPEIKKVATDGIRNAEYTVMGEPGKPGTGIVPKIQEGVADIQKGREVKATTNLANEIAVIENNYAPIRKNNAYEVDAGQASRLRIAEAQRVAGVLDNAVDVDGTIRTTQPGGAVQRYSAQTIDGAEGVIRQNLAKEAKTVNIEQIRKEMDSAVNKIFEGDELTSALKGVEREIAGIKLRADEFGNILLEKIQDAKVNTTKNINYKKDGNATVNFKKAKGRVYKEVIENNSDVSVTVDGKTYKIKDINGELAKYYTDIERLVALDGRKVKGGRLGKYMAQAAGTGIGMAAGAVFGPVGAAVGGALGGEAGGFLKGQGFMRTFGHGGEGNLPKNKVLSKAQEAGKKTPTIDLKTPDLKLGVPKGIIKTKEMIEFESKIAKNVEAQKKAIKAGDFTLVSKLKEVYKVLVSKLKDLVRKYKEIPNKQGGFVKNPFNKITIKSKLTNPEIGNIEVIKGDLKFGLGKIKEEHADVIPFISEVLPKAKVVEMLPNMKILEGKTSDGRIIRFVIDEQLGTKDGIVKKTFLNNAYFKS